MKMNVIRTIMLCGTAMSVACPAMAQENPADAQASRTEPKADTAMTDDIVVTARRRDERLQDVPVSVTALSEGALERSTVQDLRSINVLTPGLTFSNEGGAGNATLSLRGIGQIPLGEGTPGVVTYVNNMALPPDGSNLPTYDIASIQVLKGPQGTLFGKNTLGGAVLVSSKAPDYKFGGYLEATYGRFDYRELQGALNIPIVDGKVALRIAGQIRRQDPRTYALDSGPGYDNIHQDGARISLLLEPIDNLKSMTIAEYHKTDQLASGPYLLRQNFPFGVFFGPALGGFLDAQVGLQLANQHNNPRGSYDDGLNGSTSYTQSKSIMNDTSFTMGKLTLRNIFGYRQIQSLEGGNTGAVGGLTLPIGPGGASIPFTLFNGISGSDRQYLTNETQILGNFDRFNFIAGFYYNDDRPHGPGGALFTAFSIGGIPAPAVTSQVRNKNTAIYGQIGFKLTKQLTLNVGGRYSWDKSSACGGEVPGVVGWATDAECRAVAGLNNPNDGVGTVNNSSSEPSYTIGLDYKVNPDWLLYVQHRRGFRAANVNTPFFETWYTTCAGTPVPGGACFDLRPFQKTGVEKLQDFELGSKLTFQLGGARGRWNMAAYYTKYKNALQFLNTQTLLAAPPGSEVPDSPNKGSVGINAADETIWGVEAEFSVAVSENFSVSFNGAYTHIAVDRVTLPAGFPAAIFGAQDVNKFAPSFSGTFSTSWTLPVHPLNGDLVLNGDVFMTADFGGQGGEKLPGYNLANARLDWKNIGGSRLDLGVFVRNLTNEFYSSGTLVLLKFFPTSSVYLGAPRTWGVTGRYHF